jgi:hypothetical protein
MSILITIALGSLIIITLIAITTNRGNFPQGNSGYMDNGTITDIDVTQVETFIYIDDFTGAIVILTIFVALAFLLGIRIFNSGISDTAFSMIMNITFYIGIWSIFSILSYDLIIRIRFIGGFLYVVLTIIYVIGVFQKIQTK